MTDVNFVPKTPKVTLLSWTGNPLESVYSVWDASKSTGRLRTPEEIKETVDPEEVQELFRAVIKQRIPVGEHIDFIFMLENVSVSWREQAVRHRIGTKASPERIGADMVMDEIPNLADSSWWSQSMRIQDMGKFAEDEAFRVPQTILDHPEREKLLGAYLDTMTTVEHTYNLLVEHGIPMEDARELMPLGAQHRMSWKLNIGSLQHISAKRGCWILQLGIWGPVITGMIQELSSKVHPIFAEMVTPPCLDGDDFKGCVYQEEVRRRYTEDDALPPCPLHLRNHHLPESGAKSDVIANASHPQVHESYKVPRAEEMRARADEYEKFWHRDPWTGRRLKVLAE